MPWTGHRLALQDIPNLPLSLIRDASVTALRSVIHAPTPSTNNSSICKSYRSHGRFRPPRSLTSSPVIFKTYDGYRHSGKEGVPWRPG